MDREPLSVPSRCERLVEQLVFLCLWHALWYFVADSLIPLWDNDRLTLSAIDLLFGASSLFLMLSGLTILQLANPPLAAEWFLETHLFLRATITNVFSWVPRPCRWRWTWWPMWLWIFSTLLLTLIFIMQLLLHYVAITCDPDCLLSSVAWTDEVYWSQLSLCSPILSLKSIVTLFTNIILLGPSAFFICLSTEQLADLFTKYHPTPLITLSFGFLISLSRWYGPCTIFFSTMTNQLIECRHPSFLCHFPPLPTSSSHLTAPLNLSTNLIN